MQTKASGKIQLSLMASTLNKLGIEKTLKMLMAMYDKPRVSIFMNWENYFLSKLTSCYEQDQLKAIMNKQVIKQGIFICWCYYNKFLRS
jgi:hypothetical protein